jgi:hypothetical protein
MAYMHGSRHLTDRGQMRAVRARAKEAADEMKERSEITRQTGLLL